MDLYGRVDNLLAQPSEFYGRVDNYNNQPLEKFGRVDNWIVNGGGALNVADVFSTDTWLGNGSSTRSIINGLNLVGDGGLIWVKARNTVTSFNDHHLIDTDRWISSSDQPTIFSNLTSAEAQRFNAIESFNTDGYDIGSDFNGTLSSPSFVGWSFKKSPRFCNAIPYMGDGVAGREILHNLGVQAGLAIVRKLDTAANWNLQHISRGGTKTLRFSDAVETSVSTHWNNTTMTDSVVTLGTNSEFNAISGEYIMYVFAHDIADDGVIRCGEFDAAGGDTLIDLGWDEGAQYVDITPYDVTGDWEVYDSTRGETKELNPNLPAIESTTSRVTFGSGGFIFTPNEAKKYIYMAIRAES